ncbi:MAG: adenosine deaminase, partial [Saprospiraceae bacterium]|nr:adenosine deaminase [Saprospiraceae bacterium]
MNLHEWPKIELHLHLDCSLSYSVSAQLSPGLTLDRYQNEFVAPPKCKDLADFLTRAAQGFRLMQSREALRLVTLDLFDQLKKDGIIYAEIRFAPMLHLESGLSMEEVVESVLEAAHEGAAKNGILFQLILCTLRRATEGVSLQTAKLATKYQKEGVGGFDIAGNEAGFPLAPHIPAFRWAYDQGLPVTMHAGEAAGPKSVKDAITNGHTYRLGHGIRAQEDDTLLAQLLQMKVHFEVCPTSNVQTNVIGTFADHPVDRLYRAGHSVSINTDGRTLCNTTLSEEYIRLQETFN